MKLGRQNIQSAEIMGAEEEMLITLSGGAPWGFRLQGGSEQKRPLQVSKVGPRDVNCEGRVVLLNSDIPTELGIFHYH